MITLFFELLLNDMIERARITVSISSIMRTIYATNSSFLATVFILLIDQITSMYRIFMSKNY